MTTTWPTRAQLTAGFLATPCTRCQAPPGIFCRTEPGRQPKRDPYTDEPAFHQRRLDKFWLDHRGEFHLPSESVYRLPTRRGEEGAVLS